MPGETLQPVNLLDAPDVSILIPTRDRLLLLQGTLAGLTRYASDPKRAEVIVVDTGVLADDGTTEWAQAKGCQVLRWAGASYAQANNRAALMARGRYLCLANNDLLIESDVVQKLYLLARLYRDRAIIGTKLLYPNGLIQHAGVGFDLNGNPYHLWHRAPAQHPGASKQTGPAAVTFALAMIPRSLYLALSGLDEQFVNGYEDVDFCLRARELGYQIVYAPSVEAIHLTGQTAGRHDHDAANWQHFGQTWLATGRLWSALGVWPFQVQGEAQG